jgi:hypothetical protein
LEKKLSGWVASTNQSLCNLPPFPDFTGCGDNPPSFEISAIVPMNTNGVVWGAISLYRKQKAKFSEEEFRRLEIVASQAALALSNCHREQGSSPLIDATTGLANETPFDVRPTCRDANKFDYPFAFRVSLDDRRLQRWGYIFVTKQCALPQTSSSMSFERMTRDPLCRR